MSLVTALLFALSFPLMGIGATGTDSATKPNLDQMIEKYAQKKGITVEEAKAQYEAKLKDIAAKKGITVEELKKQISEGKFKGHSGKGKHKCPKGPIDEAKLKEIAEKKGITVEQLKEQMNKRHKDSAQPPQ